MFVHCTLNVCVYDTQRNTPNTRKIYLSNEETVNIMVDNIRCGSNVQNYMESTHLYTLDTCSFETVVDVDGGNKNDATTATTTTIIIIIIITSSSRSHSSSTTAAAAATNIIVTSKKIQNTFCVFAHDPTECNIFFRTIYITHG